MQEPAFPLDEAQRLLALLDSGLLDTPQEERFDRLTRLAQRIFGTEMALVSLVDRERQWFKSRQGLEACETGRDISFCGHAILHSEIFHIPDAREDARFADNPLVTGAPHIRFYAGAPLSGARGFRIGTLCIIDSHPRQLSSQELGILSDLAACVEREIAQVDLQQQKQALQTMQSLNAVIMRTQALFIHDTDRPAAFDSFLQDILALTDGDAGCVGEVLLEADGTPRFKTYAQRDTSDRPAPGDSRGWDGLFEAALARGEPVVADPPARATNPSGHHVAIPVAHAGEVVGLIGLSHRSRPFDRVRLDLLAPLVATLGQLVAARRNLERQRETERRLADVIKGTRIGTWEWNVQTGEVLVNDRWLEILGLTGVEPGAVPRQSWQIAIHPGDVARCNASIARHHAGETDYYDAQYRMQHAHGHWVWVHDRGQMVNRAADGRALLMSGTLADITARKQSEMVLSQFKSTLDQTLDCVFMFEPESLRFIYCNEGALRQVGYTREALLKMHPYDIKPSLTAQQFRVLIAPLLSGERDALTFETVHRHRDGHDVPVEIFLQYVRHPDQSPRFVAIVRDISERQRIDRMKSEFISTVSHELRTPLTAICGALGLVAGDALGPLPDKVREMIVLANKNSQRLSFLINDLLDMEKLVAGKMTFEMRAQPLLPLIEQAMDGNRAYGGERCVDLQLTDRIDDAQVLVDAQRLQQVLANLLSNALKYSPEAGTVEVAMRRLRHDRVRVSVTDHGPGIPQAFHQRIFQKFSQADASDARQKNGTGLGLAISRELVQRMGGEIGFHSEEGRGACFYFDLPLATVVAVS